MGWQMGLFMECNAKGCVESAVVKLGTTRDRPFFDTATKLGWQLFQVGVCLCPKHHVKPAGSWNPKSGKFDPELE